MTDEIALETPSEELPGEGMVGQPEADSELVSEASPEAEEPAAALAGAEASLSPEASPEPGPDSGSAPKQEKPLDASEPMVDALITPEALHDLWIRADQAQASVKTNIKALGIARKLLDLIQSARNEILAGKDHYEEAERFINEVEFRIELSRQMPAWSKKYGLPLLIYEVFWGLVASIVLIFLMNQSGESAVLDPNSTLYYLLGSVMWGGLGGVIGALISLVKHIAVDQDFDQQHLLWYLSSPIVGYGVGAVIFLILSAGLLSLTGPGQDISSPFIMYALAWLSGYQQNIFTDMLKRVLKIFSVGDDDK